MIAKLKGLIDSLGDETLVPGLAGCLHLIFPIAAHCLSLPHNSFVSVGLHRQCIETSGLRCMTLNQIGFGGCWPVLFHEVTTSA